MSDFRQKVEACGLSLKGLSRLTGHPYSRVKNWHCGRVKVPEDVMLKLTQYERSAGVIFGKDA